MSKVCEFCGKHAVAGHSISHSHRVVNRTFKPNISASRSLSTVTVARPTSARAASSPARSPAARHIPSHVQGGRPRTAPFLCAARVAPRGGVAALRYNHRDCECPSRREETTCLLLFQER